MDVSDTFIRSADGSNPSRQHPSVAEGRTVQLLLSERVEDMPGDVKHFFCFSDLDETRFASGEHEYWDLGRTVLKNPDREGGEEEEEEGGCC